MPGEVPDPRREWAVRLLALLATSLTATIVHCALYYSGIWSLVPDSVWYPWSLPYLGGLWAWVQFLYEGRIARMLSHPAVH